MPLLTIEECRQQCRVVVAYDDSLIQAHLASAEDSAAAFLNRRIFASQADMDAARAALPAEAQAAGEAYELAIEAAKAEPDKSKAEMMVALAESDRKNWVGYSRRTLHGIVANDSILAAVRMTLAHLYANAEAVVIANGTVAEVPLGALHMLRPYRREMMP